MAGLYDAYVSPALADRILGYKQRAFATGKAIGETYWLSFWRDTDQDTSIQVPPQLVLVRRGGGMNTAGPDVQGTAAGFVGLGGELRKEPPFDVRKGDRFTLPGGLSGRVSAAPLIGPVYVSVPYELEA